MWWRPSRSSGRRFVHGLVGEAIGVLVEFAPDVFEGDVADLASERACLLVERLKARTLHTIFAAHLLHQQFRVGADMQPGDAIGGRPSQRRNQAAVLSDVVGGRAERFLQLDDRAVILLDVYPVPCGAGVAARAAVHARTRRSTALRVSEQ